MPQKSKKTRGKASSQSGISLVELSGVLVISGLLIGGTLKGLQLWDRARLQKTITQIEGVLSAAQSYKSQYGFWPGDDPSANSRFGAENGEGRGFLREEDTSRFWDHLLKSHSVSAVKVKKEGGAISVQGAVGGAITLATNPQSMAGTWLVLGNDGALLTPAQAEAIDKALDDGNPTSGDVRAVDGPGQDPGSCVQNERYSSSGKRSCVVYVFLCE